MPGRQRLQVPQPIRVAHAPDEDFQRQRRGIYGTILERIRNVLSEHAQDAPRDQKGQRQQRLPGSHCRQGTHPHERYALDDTHGICSVPGKNRKMYSRRRRRDLRQRGRLAGFLHRARFRNPGPARGPAATGSRRPQGGGGPVGTNEGPAYCRRQGTGQSGWVSDSKGNVHQRQQQRCSGTTHLQTIVVVVVQNDQEKIGYRNLCIRR
mmetsp:Transcript_27599/g.60780  ORF Transcript_27599/g.60780 Transcript_27599/m.60780 type:complete len:208 (+) Transcript_27599:215-838(+)